MRLSWIIYDGPNVIIGSFYGEKGGGRVRIQGENEMARAEVRMMYLECGRGHDSRNASWKRLGNGFSSRAYVRSTGMLTPSF